MSRHIQICWIYSLNMHFLHLLVCVCLYVCMYASFPTYLSINYYYRLLNTWLKSICILSPGLFPTTTATAGVFCWNPSLQWDMFAVFTSMLSTHSGDFPTSVQPSFMSFHQCVLPSPHYMAYVHGCMRWSFVLFHLDRMLQLKYLSTNCLLYTSDAADDS